jgi:Na+/H+ antiporter NhaD/arsenite permease-like protein
MKSRNQRLKLYTSVLAIVFTAVSTAQLSSMTSLIGDITNNVYAKYSNDQAQSFANDCGLDGVTGT